MRVKSLITLPLLALAASGCRGDPEPRAVPDVRGQRLDVAERRLDGAGLEYERVGGGSFGIVVRSNWRVCDQDPKPGRRAGKVTLIVDRSCPPRPARTFVVPDLIGERLSDAEARLVGRGIPFRVERLETFAPPRSAEVCDQEPAPGVRAAEVTLYAARDCTPPPPAEPPPPMVPSVVGEDLDDAELALDSAGLDYVVEPSGPGPVVEELWEVCAQTPLPGRRAWTVVLHVRDDCS
jgi:beta-lactam-binding protein with PASTA domain